MKRVCVQGLGYVGAAMATAVALARNREGKPKYSVTGVDLPTKLGLDRVDSINAGEFPFSGETDALSKAMAGARNDGNLKATTSVDAYADADIVIVDVQLDVSLNNGEINSDFSVLEKAIKTIGNNVPRTTLIIIETTVPPGTCENMILPILRNCYSIRGIDPDDVKLAHSYERVMPGENYLDSLINYWRVYSANTDVAANECEKFLTDIINVKKFPLKRMSSLNASEAAKILENTYRAVNIAFIQEWTNFAEQIGFDLFEVIDAIKMRPTHSNIRHPGLGVGGYCLPKDPLFTYVSLNKFFPEKDVDFPFAKLAVKTNLEMPYHCVDRLKDALGESLTDKSVLLCGVSYRQNVGDSRNSPSEILARQLFIEGASVTYHDPYVSYWEEMATTIDCTLPRLDNYDVVIFAVPHTIYQKLDMVGLALSGRCSKFLFDTVNILSKEMRVSLREQGIKVESIGRSLSH